MAGLDFAGVYRVDSKALEGVGEQLVALVKPTLGANAVLPHPFPVGQQLSDLGISSLKMVNLMLAVELGFDSAIPQAEVPPENFPSGAALEALAVRALPLRRPEPAALGAPTRARTPPPCVSRLQA